MLLRLIPIGDVPSKILTEVSDEVHELLRIKIKIMDKLDIPKQAYNQWRRQYDAERVMKILSGNKEARFIDKSLPVLFLTEFDIYYKGLNFVFGLEDPTLNTMIVSYARLKPEFYGKRTNFYILMERIVKETIHEIGHYLGLSHCRHPFCVMNFSPSVDDVDRKEKVFCKDCKIKLSMRGFNF